ADGRLSTRSPSANPTSLYSEDGRYVWKSGTSMACPTVAGGAALIYEWFIANKGVAPTPAMVKAIMINTAIDFATPDIPNQNEGWGRMYMPTFFDPPAPFILHDAPTELTTGVTDTYSVSYSNPAEPLKITLAYTDRYALAGAPITLLNQVNLEVESPTGSIYSGNAFVNGWSQAGTNPIATFDTNGDGKDDRNNVECVYIPAGSLEPGQYTIRIIGFNVPADADNDGSNDQDYSLVIYNGEDVSSKGTISLDQELYAIEDTVTIEVGDTDLNTLPGSPQSVTVDIDSDSETGVETVLLTETGDDTSRFVGTKTISATNGGGILEVSDGDTITVTYDDADDGSGPATVTDTALVDGNVEPISGLTVDWWGVTNTKDVVSSVSFTRGAQTNDYSFTHDQDDSYHQIVETVSGGSGRMNIDFQYTINIDP
ncbi:MAG: S8 family serine peptidase, partial [Thermoplasmata archaeon]|nr:S8 family serine peptidase [Thermoplasmata archaeon]